MSRSEFIMVDEAEEFRSLPSGYILRREKLRGEWIRESRERNSPAMAGELYEITKS